MNKTAKIGTGLGLAGFGWLAWRINERSKFKVLLAEHSKTVELDDVSDLVAEKIPLFSLISAEDAFIEFTRDINQLLEIQP